MDNFDTVRQEGNDNVIGKNIIYKSRLNITIYHKNDCSGFVSSNFLLFQLMLSFILSLLATELYLSYMDQSHQHLILIIGLSITFFFSASIVLLFTLDAITPGAKRNQDKKNNMLALMMVAAVVGFVTLMVYLNPGLFITAKNSFNGALLIILLLVSFVNFVLGGYVYFEQYSHAESET